MSKRKATTDIHPDVRDGNPATNRFKFGGTYSHLTNARKSPISTAAINLNESGSESPEISSPSSRSTATPSSDFETEFLVKPLALKCSEDNQLKQPDTCTIVAKRGSHPEPDPPNTEISLWDYDPVTMRSQYFMENMTELNRSFAIWINSCIKADPTAILTRVFIDHQRQVQALFDEERMHTDDMDKLLVLRAQEKVLQQLKEVDEEGDCSSGSDSDDEIPHNNGPIAIEASPILVTPSVAPLTNTVAQKDILNPFLNNNAINGFKPCALDGNNIDQVAGNVKDLERKPEEGVVEKPTNFGAFSFASACSEAAAKAAAAKEQESEETNDDSPPKVEFTPVQEDGAIYTKRCKIFFKKEKEEGYEDRGIGNLFVKPVSSTNRHQLIVRSETSLGNLLVNVLLSPDIPIKKMGQKDVMLVMVPTPGSGIRVVMVRMKDGVDEVVEMLTKYSTI